MKVKFQMNFWTGFSRFLLLLSGNSEVESIWEELAYSSAAVEMLVLQSCAVVLSWLLNFSCLNKIVPRWTKSVYEITREVKKCLRMSKKHQKCNKIFFVFYSYLHRPSLYLPKFLWVKHKKWLTQFKGTQNGSCKRAFAC